MNKEEDPVRSRLIDWSIEVRQLPSGRVLTFREQAVKSFTAVARILRTMPVVAPYEVIVRRDLGPGAPHYVSGDVRWS